MFKRVLIILAVLLAILSAVIAVQPSEFTVTRQATMTAPAATVFAQVNDFHNWNAWSPWAKLDPHAKNSFEGPASGKGAMFKWSGNENVGVGQMTITESKPNSLIHINLEFIKPFAGTNLTEFTFTPTGTQGDQTEVQWRMSGKKNFMTKAMGLVMNCDTMIGGQFEKGLASIQSIVEKQAAK